MRRSSHYRCIAAALVLAVAQGAAYGADAPPSGDTVSKSDYDKVLQRLDKVEKELATIKGENEEAKKEHDQDMEDLQKQVKIAIEKSEESHTGDTKFLVAGDFETGFTSAKHSNSTFDAGFAPLFLWEFNKQLLFEGAFDVSFNSDGSTQTNLSLANISYLANDYVTVGAGMFSVPFGQYHNHFDPPWINKLPDDPLVFSDGGLAPGSEVGAWISGAVPIHNSKLIYALYATNGPTLVTDDPANLGNLDWDISNGGDLNNNKAYGGRLAFVPVPELEVGYSMMCAQASSTDFPTHVNAHMYALDANYVKQWEPIGGTVTARAEWIWSDTGQATYTGPIDPNTNQPTFGPTTFNNSRNGGYLTLAYRPTMSSNKILRNLEAVVRYDRLDTPQDAPAGGHEQRYTLGLDYWLQPRVVVKVAYEFDDKTPGPSSDAFMVQFGVGF
jgi:hypothetical protein